MRQLMTIRIDPDVLQAARGRASEENRTLTNYIETVLRVDLGLMALSAPRRLPSVAISATAGHAGKPVGKRARRRHD